MLFKTTQIKQQKAKANKKILEQVFRTWIFMSIELTDLPLGTIPLVLGRNRKSGFGATQVW